MPDRRVPTEQELARHYGVAVLTVRQAQQLLIAEGLLRKEQGRGTFVTDRAKALRKVLLVCGLHYGKQGPAAAVASPYFLDSIQFCQQAAAARGLPLETVWIEHFPHDDRVAESVGPVTGYIFLGCDPHHQLVMSACEEKAHHVHLGKTLDAARTVWFNLETAGSLAWRSIQAEVEARRLPVVTVSVRGENAGAQALSQLVPGGVRSIGAPNTLTVWEAEQWCYRAIRRLCEESPEPRAFVFLDDILARGGTRALLQAGMTGKQCPVAVVSGKQELASYGLPVIYITHDTEAEARRAVEMLLAQIEGDPAGAVSRESSFVIEPHRESEDQAWMRELGIEDVLAVDGGGCKVIES